MQDSIAHTSSHDATAFYSLIKSPVKFRLYLLKNLPAAYFSGLRIKEVNEARAVVTIPFKWFTKNPFRSTYFACLSMAAEMSTGLLALGNIYRRTPKVSMLVVSLEGTFLKKATGITAFTCEDGVLIKQTIEGAINSGEAQTVKAKSVGRNKNNEVVAEFFITWSFKKK